jgi:hypothetical protein
VLGVATAAWPQTCRTAVRFHFVALSDSNGANAPTFGAADVQPWIDAANSILGAPIGVHFEYRADLDWEALSSSNLNNGMCFNDELPAARAEADRIVAGHPGKIVVFLRRGCTASPSPFSGVPSSYSAPPDIGQAIPAGWAGGLDYVVTNNNFLPKDTDSLFAHEVGHFLGLYHTHPGTGGPFSPTASASADQQAIDWLKAGNNMDGDLITDTPEDPSPNVFTSCSVATRTLCASRMGPCWTFTPDKANVMSYYNCNATSAMHISKAQAAKIRATLADASRSTLCNQPCFPNFHNLGVGEVEKCLAYWKYREGFGPQALSVDWSGSMVAGTLKPNSNGWYKTADRNDYEAFSQFWPFFGFSSSHYNWRPATPVALGASRSLPGASSIQTFHRMDANSFVSQWNQQFSAGRALVDVSVTNSNPLEISAVWANQGGNTSATRFANNDADLIGFSDAFYGNRIRLDRVVPIASGSGHTYLANWNASTALRGLFSSANSSYQSLFNTLAGLGYSLHDLEYFENGGLASVWEAPHNECTQGSRLHPDTDACTKKISAADPFCSATLWDGICVAEVSSICGRSCPP